ncbi:outer membrane beta-barrel family protein [Mucilaginibacter sp. UR6-11]|uniref:outer membrane beta-barrel family protein n=1 Tax=Mucilaginibacter sp. UR6-11 TaxID=1435644 RepID=UPI001E42AA8D|nr:outer membrane beta-barrel family protein [Mucilaginibacter sp. UR6-11]MCC8424143.1 outer membrane beta-barrel protein [Mucilaginibacter sp. UR6-11]
MRFIKGCLLLAFLLSVYTRLYAQTGLSGIHGKVYEEKHRPAEAATVILLAATDSAIIKSTVCDDKGLFNFNVKPGNYLLLISKIGYDQSLTGPYTITPDKEIAINALSLTLHLPQLKEVSITAQRSYVEVKPDRVLLNVQSSIISEGNSVFEILRQAPGVHAENKGDISIIGRSNALVMVDGKLVHLTGQDLVDYLQSVPGSSVRQIELITNPSAKYDASGGGIINIITKKGTNAGTNFTVATGAGYGRFGRGNASLNFNNRMGKVNIFGNYNYAYKKSDHTFLTDRFINYKNNLSEYAVNYYAIQQVHNQNFSIGTDYALSAKHTVGVLVSGTVNDDDFAKDNNLSIINNGVLDSTIITKSKLSRGLTNISYDVNYTGKLDTMGKILAADIVFNNVERQSSEYIDNYFYNSAYATYRPALKLQNLSPANIHIWAAKIDYVNPLSKTARLEGGLKYSWVQSNNDLVFGPQVNGVYKSSPNFSSTFLFKENINSGYINYSGKLGKANLVAGLRVEQTNTNGSGTSATMMSNVKKRYLDWFPQLQLNYQVDAKNNFDFSFNRGVTRPAYDIVNPFLYFADLYDYRQGNPNLLPQYANKIQISHTYNKKIITTLYGVVVSNFYGFVDYAQNDSTKVSRSITQNFGTYATYGLKFYAPVNFTGWWSANFSVDASYQRIKAYPQNGDLNKGTQAISLASTQSFRLSGTLAAELSGDYESPTFYGIGLFKADYYVNAGISKQMLNKNGKLSLNITDIFNTHRDFSTINYRNLNMTVYDKVQTRMLKIAFTYHFGNISLKSTAKHSAGNEDEQKRAGGVAGSTITRD